MSEEVIINPDGRPPMEVDFLAPEVVAMDIEMEAVARDLGLTVVTGLRLRRSKEMGEHLNRMGAVRVGRGQYLIAADRLQHIVYRLMELLDKTTDLGTINEVLPNIVALEKQISHNITAMVTAGTAAEVARDLPKLAPPPVPVVFNNYAPANQNGNNARTVPAEPAEPVLR